MSSDLIALVVAMTLGFAVVFLGLRRDLADVTRNWLPRFGEASEQVPAALGPSDGGQGRRQLSPRQRRWAIGAYLLIGLWNAALVCLSADDRLFHAVSAALFGIGAVVFLLKGRLSNDR